MIVSVRADLREEDLVLVAATKGRLEAADRERGVAPDGEAADAGHDAAMRFEEGTHDTGRVQGHADRQAEAADGVAPRRIGAPAVPVQGRPVDHAHLRVVVEQGHLMGEALRQVDVVGIEKGQIATPGGADAQVARGAHAAIRVVWMLEVTDTVGCGCRCGPRRFARIVARAVVDQQQLPIRQRLRANAGDGLIEKGRARVQEDDDDADGRRGFSHGWTACCVFPCHARPIELTGGAKCPARGPPASARPSSLSGLTVRRWMQAMKRAAEAPVASAA
ncbi:MAG: hypothetical protein R3D25_12985 [Geminicoccaceae bacterium]